jgi:recombinational DNA repair protein RecR
MRNSGQDGQSNSSCCSLTTGTEVKTNCTERLKTHSFLVSENKDSKAAEEIKEYEALLLHVVATLSFLMYIHSISCIIDLL